MPYNGMIIDNNEFNVDLLFTPLKTPIAGDIVSTIIIN